MQVQTDVVGKICGPPITSVIYFTECGGKRGELGANVFQ